MLLQPIKTVHYSCADEFIRGEKLFMLLKSTYKLSEREFDRIFYNDCSVKDIIENSDEEIIEDILSAQNKISTLHVIKDNDIQSFFVISYYAEDTIKKFLIS